jgi:hypothetical protein
MISGSDWAAPSSSSRTVCRIFGDFDFREPLHARCVDLGDRVLERLTPSTSSETVAILDFPFKS